MNHLANGKKLRTLFGSIGLAALLSSAIGCGMGTMQANSGLSATGGQGSAMQGSAHGGQQPITGATVKLFAAGATGYGTGATAIPLNTTVTTSDGTGITITGYSISTIVATFMGVNSLSAGNRLTLNGFPPSSNSLNGQTVVVLPVGLSGTQFETSIVGSDTTSTDAGTANLSTNTNANAGNAYNTLQPGGFTISGDYTCPAVTGGSQVYVVITGGNPGITPSDGNTVAGNPNLALMTAIGACGSGGNLSSVPFVAIDEYSTVAAVAALQQFMAPPASGNALAPSVGAPSTTDGGYTIAAQGLINAFNMVPNLSDLGTGVAPTATSPVVIAGATPEATKIGLLANILASCVNSGVSGTTLPLTGPSVPCATLFTDALPAGATTAPADTIQAAWYMLQSANYYGSAAKGGFYTSIGAAASTASATANVAAFNTYISNLVGLATPQPIYPAVSSATDFTIAVNFAPWYGPSHTFVLNSPTYVAIDQYGNAWFPNTGTAAGAATPVASVTELSPAGAVIMDPATTFTASATGGATGSANFTLPTDGNTRTLSKIATLAIDTTGQAWVPNLGDQFGTHVAGSMGIFAASSGAGVGSTGANGGYYTGGIPFMAAIDGDNNVFLSVGGNKTTTFVDEKSIAKFAGGTGTYTLSTSVGSSSSHPNAYTFPNSSSGLVYLAVDANTNNGPFVWDNQNPACKVGTAQAYGALGQFSTSALATPATANYVTSNGFNLSSCQTTDGDTTAVAAATLNTFGIAVDKYNNIWESDEFGSSSTLGFDGVTYFLQNPTLGSSAAASTGVIGATAADSASYADKGVAKGSNIQKPTHVAVDGNNDLWIADSGFAAVSKAAYLPGTGVVLESPTGGFVHSIIAGGTGIAIDPSGNVWVSNASASTVNSAGTNNGYRGTNGDLVSNGNTVTVIVGAAAPTITPLSVQLKANKIGQLP